MIVRAEIRRLMPYWLLVFALMSVCQRAMAQDDALDADGAYGDTSIEYQSDGSLDAYSETDMVPDLQAYYEACVQVTIDGPNNSYLASSPDECAWSDAVDAEVSAPSSEVQPNTTYTANGSHYGILVQYGWQFDCNCEACIDYYDMAFWESMGIDDLFDYEFLSTASGDTYTQPYNEVILGGTYDSASTTTPLACGDDRDYIIRQYAQYTVALQPTCSDFTNDEPPNYWGHDNNYTFSNLSTSHDYPGWAILRSVLLAGLDTTVSDYGPGTPGINSGYRDPSTNASIGGAHNSQHLYGTAADLATGGNQTVWNEIATAGKQAGACREPYWESSYNHVHLDWRGVGCPQYW